MLSTTSKDVINTARRREIVLELRKQGKTYRAIAEAVRQQLGDELPAGWDERYAYKDVKRELDRLRDEIAEDAQMIRQLELERLDLALDAILPMVRKGNLGAVDRLIRLSESRRKLLGLDAPQRQEMAGPGGEALQMNIAGVPGASPIPITILHVMPPASVQEEESESGAGSNRD